MALPPERQRLAEKIGQLQALEQDNERLDRADLPALEAVEAALAAVERARELSKDHEFCVQTSEAMIDIAATRIIGSGANEAGG